MTAPTLPETPPALAAADLRGSLRSRARRALSARGRSAAFIAKLSLAFIAAGTLSGGAGAQGAGPVVLHEFIPPNAGEDISFAATTLDGDLPAAIQTPSGIATAPDPQKPPSTEHVYSGATTDDSPGSTYEPDRDTRRPNVEHYDDPFSPSTVPFKRLRAYDTIDESYTLRVQNQSLEAIPVGGSVGGGDEPFYGDISVDLIPGQPVRIPTVGPGARVLRLHTNPESQVELLRDGADNWFARGLSRNRVRLIVQIAIRRDAFGSDFPDVEWSRLSRHLRFTGFGHQREAFTRVAQAIGISQTQRPKEVLRKMVDYFRSFESSDDPPKGNGDIYLDLALTKKGVCRHRSFAFLVTALYIGLPARMVVNEAHAWVEVNDGDLWHRIDLGGAAANLETNTDPNRPRYVPPPDPFAWPATADSGQDLGDRTRPQNQDQTSDPNNPSPTDPTAPPPSTPPPTPTAPPTAPPAEVSGEPTLIDVAPVGGEVRRGFPFHLRGEVKSAGAPCPHVRVDVVLFSGVVKQGAAVGSLSTDDDGRFDGAVVIPRDFGLGEYRLRLETPGDARCRAGRSK